MESPLKNTGRFLYFLTFAAFIIGFIVPFNLKVFTYHFANLLQSEMPLSWAYLIYVECI